MTKKGFSEADVVRYGTLADLDRLTRSEVTVSLISQKVDYPEGILDEEFVERRKAPGFKILGCVGSCLSEAAFDPALVHEVIDQVREVLESLQKHPQLVSDQDFRELVYRTWDRAQLMTDLIDVIDPTLAVHFDQLALTFDLLDR